jgi:hypothetical protein
MDRRGYCRVCGNRESSQLQRRRELSYYEWCARAKAHCLLDGRIEVGALLVRLVFILATIDLRPQARVLLWVARDRLECLREQTGGGPVGEQGDQFVG